MTRLTVLTVLAAVCNIALSEHLTDCCNNQYIRKIKNQWCCEGVTPSRIIETGVLLGPDFVKFATPGFRNDISLVDCLFTYWAGVPPYLAGDFQSHILYKNGSSVTLPEVHVTEGPGRTIQLLADGRQIVRYHINTEDPAHVSCFYKCDPTADPEDPPQAVCKVYDGYSEEALERAVKKLENTLGVKLSVRPSENCA